MDGEWDVRRDFGGVDGVDVGLWNGENREGSG